MNNLLLQLADALDETRAGGDKQRQMLAERARRIAAAPLRVCVIGSDGLGREEAYSRISLCLLSDGVGTTIEYDDESRDFYLRFFDPVTKWPASDLIEETESPPSASTAPTFRVAGLPADIGQEIERRGIRGDEWENVDPEAGKGET